MSHKMRAMTGLLAAALLAGSALADGPPPAVAANAESPAGLSADRLAKAAAADKAPVHVTRLSGGEFELRWSGLTAPVTIYALATPDAKRREVAGNVTGTSKKVKVRDSEHPYFYLIDDDGNHYWAAERLLPLEGGRNFRDLGGYLVEDGEQVRWGVLFRSGAMADLTAADQQYLGRLGIRQVCDFRTNSERKSERAGWLESNPSVAYYTRDYEMSGANYSSLETKGVTAENARSDFIRLYRNLPYEQEAAYKAMFRMLVDGKAPLAFNCTAGKDRAGLAAALVLTALGVPRETVFADYQLSNIYLDGLASFERKRKPGEADGSTSDFLANMPKDVIQVFLSAQPAYLQAAFDEISRRSGSVEKYFHDTLGLSDKDLESLREQYLYSE